MTESGQAPCRRSFEEPVAADCDQRGVSFISCQLDKLTPIANVESRMRHISVGNFKAQFSDLLNKVRQGERIAIQYGRRKQTVAILIPASEEKTSRKRPLGLLKGKASFKLRADFKMTEDDFTVSELSP